MGANRVQTACTSAAASARALVPNAPVGFDSINECHIRDQRSVTEQVHMLPGGIWCTQGPVFTSALASLQKQGLTRGPRSTPIGPQVSNLISPPPGISLGAHPGSTACPTKTYWPSSTENRAAPEFAHEVYCAVRPTWVTERGRAGCSPCSRR